MNRNLSLIAFILGLAAVIWIAVGYVGGSSLAFGVSCVIAAVYVAGALEMRRFFGSTSALARALDSIPEDLREDLGEWLQQIPAALRNAVRLRIAGERVALPGPGVTPYLVGLLVLPSLPLLLKMAARHEHRQALEPRGGRYSVYP